MSGPWEKFQAAPAESGPWSKFSGAAAKQEPSLLDDIKQGAGNLAAGLVRGAGSIGATLLAPVDIAKDALDGKGLSLESNRQRRAAMDAGLREMGAETDSLMYKGGKLAGEVAGTAGAGGVVAKGLTAAAPAITRVAPAAANVLPKLASSIQSGGFTLGSTGGSTAGNALLRLTGGAVNGAVTAGLANPEDAGMGAVIGGATPLVVKGAGKLGNKLVKEVSPEVVELYQKAQKLGIDIPADRIADSKPLNALSASLNYMPMSGRAATETKMNTQLQRAVSRTFGQDSDNITQALRKAGADLGSKFDDVLTKNTVAVDTQFLDDLAASEQMALNELGADSAKIIKKQIDEIISKGAAGQIDGQAAYNIKKTLDRIGNRNAPEAYYARELKKNLMSALNRSLGPDEAAAFAKVRQQYGNMLELEGLAQNGAEGGISIARLANLKNINNPDLQDIADIAAQFVKGRESAHGAAQRVTLGSLAGPIAVSTGTVPLMAGGMAAGRVANSVLNSNAAKNALINRAAASEGVERIGSNALLRALGLNATLSSP